MRKKQAPLFPNGKSKPQKKDSLIVVVTFDIHNRKSGDHDKVTNDLGDIAFDKCIRGKVRNSNALPNNIYVFSLKGDTPFTEKKSSEIIRFTRSNIRKIFKRHDLNAKYFIVCGRKWAWAIGKIGAKNV